MSNMIKSSHYVPLDSTKIIEAAALKIAKPKERQATSDMQASHQASDLEQAVRDKQLEAEIERLMEQARLQAEEILQQAREQSERLLSNTERELEEMRAARRLEIEAELEQVIREAREQAYQEGLAKGEQEAEAMWKQTIETAAGVLQDAHALKREVISEAEPFLLELSVQIAETIIARQLTLEPSWTKELVKGVLARERRKGIVTLCVSPEQFPYIREARGELSMVLDSQAELQIVPDTSVRDFGCVVRTDFGSLDARIDSQLIEIKQALLQVYTSEHEEEEA